MKKTLNQISETIFYLTKLIKFAYQIDKSLVIKYYFSIAVGAVTPIGAAFGLRYVIDNFTNNSQTLTNGVIFGLIAYYGFRYLEDVIYWGLNTSYYDYLLRNKLQNGLSFLFSQKKSSLDLEYLEDAALQTELTKVEQSYQWQLPDAIRIWGYLFRHIIGVLTITITLLSIKWWIPLLIMLLAIPRVYFKAKHGNFVWSMYGSGAPDAKKLWYLGELLTQREAITEMRVFQSTPAVLNKFKQLQNNLFKLFKKPLDNFKLMILIFPTLELILTVFILSIIVPETLSGVITLGTLTLLITTMEQLKAHVSWGASSVGELYEKSLYIKPYFQIMELEPKIKEVKKSVEFKKIAPPVIEFKNVSFAYANGREILKNISFTINPKENVALVGINGAGKSTLIKLLCRFYDVTSGEILINGVNIKDLKLTNWYSHLGTLFQDFVKYNFTVRENITLGAPTIHNQQRMIDAATQSGASEFIDKLPKKYDQMLGRQFDEGDELSGGQWQKLAIARAFYESAPVLIMDEPTSAIDAQAEYEIFQNLEKVYKDKTLILVSHRFSTVRNAEKIIVINNGEIAEMGSHQELMSNNQLYAQMFSTQAKGYQ